MANYKKIGFAVLLGLVLVSGFMVTQSQAVVPQPKPVSSCPENPKAYCIPLTEEQKKKIAEVGKLKIRESQACYKKKNRKEVKPCLDQVNRMTDAFILIIKG